MVVCKFFQQGNCRYGQNCRFDHIYGSKYTYHASAPQSTNSAQGGITDDQLVNQVQQDVQAALKGGQWILSCYSPYKERPNFPGITDLSMEEARLFVYEAKANNTIDQAVAYMNNLFKESTQKYEQLLQASPAVIKVLRSVYKGELVQSPFTNTPQNSGFGSGSAATSIFRSAVQGTSVFGQNSANTTPSIFSSNTNPPSVFGQPPASNTSVFNQSPGFDQKPNQAANVFAQANTENAKSIFAQATQNVFGNNQPTNVFGPSSPDTTAKSIFAQATQNVFSGGQPVNPASVFGDAAQSVFGQPKPATPFGQPQDPFGKPQDPFSKPQDPFSKPQDPFSKPQDPFSKPQDPFSQQNNPFASAAQNDFQANQQASDSNNYSDINILTPEHIELFKADNFKLGFIPEVPPPYSLCF